MSLFDKDNVSRSDEKADKEKLLAQVKSFLKASAKVQEPRAEVYEDWEKFQRGSHWGAKADGTQPSIPLTWYIWDSQVAKVCDRPAKLAVVPQEATDFPLYLRDELSGEPQVDITGKPIKDPAHPFNQMAEENREAVGSDLSDNELYAKFMNALLQREWETNGIASKLYQSASMAAWYSECWPVVGRDDLLALRGESPIFVDLVHPKRVIKDPDATGVHDMRFIGFEVDRTRAYIRQRWGDEIADDLNAGDNLDSKNTFDGIRPDSERSIIKTQVLYIRDDSLEKFQNDPLIEIDPEDSDTFYELPRYKRGWFKVIVAQEKELLDGPEDADRLPMCWLPWHPIPGTLDALGVMDLYRTMNFQIDQSMYFALENAKMTGQNYFFYDQASFVGQQDLLNNLIGKAVPVTTSDGNIPQKIMAVQGLDVAQSHYQNINLNRELMEAMSGSQDLKVGSNLPRDASGEFMKEMKAGINARLAIIRDEQLLRVAKEIARIVLDLLLQDDEPITVRLPGVGEPKYATIIPSALDMSNEEFEAKFDIVVEGSASEPHSAIERDQFYGALIAELSQMPPPLAELRIKLSDWSNKGEIRMALKEFWDMQAQQAQAAQEAEAQKPNEAMLKAQAAAAGQTSKDFSQGMQDISKAMLDAGDPSLAIDILLAATPVVLAIAQGQEPDITGLAAIRARFQERSTLEAVMRQAAATAVNSSDPQTPAMPVGTSLGT